MHADALTRGLLALILLCLVVLVAHELAEDPHGNVRLVYFGSPVNALTRVDIESGDTWRLERLGGENRWVPFPLPDAVAAPGVLSRDAASAADTSPAALRTPPAGGTPDAAAPPPTDEEIQLLIDSLLGSELPTDVRVWTAQQLGGIEGSGATGALIEALGDAEPEVVAAAAQALAERSDPRIAPALAKLRDHPDPAVQRAARGVRIRTLD